MIRFAPFAHAFFILSASALAVGDGKAEAGAKDAANALKSVKAEGGLKIDLWAQEPLLANPVAFSPDERGRWFVSESYRQEGRIDNGKTTIGGVVDNRGHMGWLNEDIASRTTDDRLAMMRKYYPDAAKFKEAFETQEERIVALDDSDGDGKADKSTVFADGFRDALDGTAAGILARGNEVWWTNIPSLWRFQDSNGDAKADVKDRMLSGFGVKFAFRGHDMHGLRFGPDGKIYFTIGDRGINVKNKEGKDSEVSDTGCVMRCNPDGTGFEVFATGVRNPQELAFDEFGNLFTGDNNSDAGDRARFVQLVEGGDCGWRMTFQYLEDRGPWNRELLWDEKESLKAKYIIPPIANLSNGPSGLTYNPGTGLSKKFAGKFFLSDFRGGASSSVVHEITLTPMGAWFELKERRDLVKGVLTTDVEFGPDGGLYVLDWVEGWSGVNKGRIFKLTSPEADAAKQAEVKRLLAEGMNARPDAELEKLLGHEDQRVRQAAQFQLVAKSAVGPLTNAATKGQGTLARIHGVWGLGQLRTLPTLVGLLSDGDGEVRAQAARVLGDNRATTATEALVGMLKDSHPRARFYAAIALGKAGGKAAVDALFTMLAENEDKDPILRHGAVMGLVGCADAGTLAAKATDGNLAVRNGAVVALRRLKSPQVAAFLADADQGVILEAARAIYDVGITDAMPALASLLGDRRIKDPNILLRVVNAHYRLGTPENAGKLAAYAADKNAREFGRKEAIFALTAWANPDPKDRLTFQWRPLAARSGDAAAEALKPVVAELFAGASGTVLEAAAISVAKLEVPGATDSLNAVASDEKASKAARGAALIAMARLKDARVAKAAGLALLDKDAKLRATALKVLVGADPEAALKAIGTVLTSDSPAIEKQGAVIALAESKTPAAEKVLSGLLDELIAGKLAQEVRLDVYEAGKKIPGLAAKVQQWRASLPANDKFANYRLSLSGGDAERGKKLFREHPTAQCFKCHKAEGGDSLVGPDLTKIGATLDRTMILESIVFPNAKIAAGFQIVVLELNDGMTVAGRLLAEANGQLSVETVDANGKPQIVKVVAGTIKNRISAPSAMPETIREQLTRAELRDIVEYLATRK